MVRTEEKKLTGSKRQAVSSWEDQFLGSGRIPALKPAISKLRKWQRSRREKFFVHKN